MFLHTAAGATAGLAGILATHTSPLYAATRTLTMLTMNHFVPASDEHLRKWAKEFAKAHKCQVKIDFIAHRDLSVTVAKEQETRTGHDVVLLVSSKPHLHHDDLETLAFMEARGAQLGGWYDLACDAGQVAGRWVALPWFYIPQCMTYRDDLYQHHGFPPPTTWEAWKETGKAIKAASGHKVGIALSQTEDANVSAYALLWAYGASTVNKKRQVSINSPGTRQALAYVKDLYESCMTNEVLSWDDASNNQAFLGGTYSWVHNAVSIYSVAKDKVPDIAQVTSHAQSPAGPGGEHGVAVPINYGIWTFAPEKQLAKAFLRFMTDPPRLEENFHATLTYNAPLFQAGDQFDWTRDPKTAMLKDYIKTAHMIGWPAPSDRQADQARAAWVVPNMFTYYATAQKSLEEAVTWAEGALQRIYTGKA
jgi:multiple sugar transport system substrate-binding protein